MQARQRSLEVAVFRLSKAKRVSESSLSTRSRVCNVQMCYCLPPHIYSNSKFKVKAPCLPDPAPVEQSYSI